MSYVYKFISLIHLSVLIYSTLVHDSCQLSKLEFDVSSTLLTNKKITNEHKEQAIVLDESGHECGRFN